MASFYISCVLCQRYNCASFLTIKLREGAPNETPSLSFGEPNLINVFSSATLIYDDGREITLPDEHSQMTYYCEKTKLTDGRSLADVLRVASNVELDQVQTEEIPIRPMQRIQPPDGFFFPTGVVRAVRCTVKGKKGIPIKGNVKVDASSFTYDVIYTNVLTGEVTSFEAGSLPLGAKRVSPGRFYFICHPLIYYYCDAITGDKIRWFLVESFQSGDLLQAVLTQSVKYSPHYIPVTDKKTINRLSARLDIMKKRRNDNAWRPGG
jgi:hypothetical protein